MSTSPAKHKSSHHHHHRDHHHSSSTSGHSSGSTAKLVSNLSSYIKVQDSSKVLPHYSIALSKPHDECLPMDELDFIQNEMENLLSSVALRYRVLKVEYDHLEDRKHQKKNTDKDKASSPGASGKRKRDDKKSSSKDRYSHKLKSGPSNSPAHSQHTDHSSNIDVIPYSSTSTVHTHSNHKLVLPKNDVPNKFLLSVEPYCMPITQEDIKLLDDLIDEYTEPLVPSIPELGSHYAVRWTSDDIRDDQDNSSGNSKSKRGASNSNATDLNDSKKGKDKNLSQGICGPLTQHLISALLEENVEMQSDIVGCSDSIVQDSSDSCAENNSSSANRAQTSAITSLLKSGIDVEKRLKKELLDLGILEPSDFAKDKDDEVLSEIKRVRTELQAIAEYNRDELKVLRAAAKEEMKRLEVKRKLDKIDQEIIEAYKRVFDAKQKRRPLLKHERNEIYRLADEQKRLSDQLEAMPIPGLNFAVCSSIATPSSSKTAPASNTSKP